MSLQFSKTSIFTNLTKFLLLIILIISSCKKADFIPLQKSSDLSVFFMADSTISIEVKRVIDAMKSRNDAELIAGNIQQSNGVPLWSHAKISRSEDFQTKANNNSFNMNGDTIVIIPLMIPNSNFINGFIRAKLNGEVSLDLFRGGDYDLYNTNTNSINPDKAALQIIWLNTEIFSTTKYKIPDPSLFKINGVTYSGNQERILTVNSITDLASSGKFATVEICTTMPNINDGCSCSHHDFNQCDCTTPGCCWITSCEEIYLGGGGGSGGSGSPSPLPGPNGGGGGGGSGGDPFPCPSTQDKAVPLPGCNPPGPGPVILVPTSAVIVYLTNQLQLNIQEINWLIGHQDMAIFLESMLLANQYQEDDVIGTDPSAVISSRIILNLSRIEKLEGPYDLSYFNVIHQNYNSANSIANFDPLFYTYYRITCILLRIENPDWSNWRIAWEAMREIVHMSLDLAGLVPLIGEVADLANGVIYTIEGDGLNATLAAASMVPVAGWASTSLKYCKKTIDIVAGSTIVGKTSLRWEKTAGNIIRFGNKDQLRKVLNLAVGSGTQAHHIIPWEHCGHPLIQKAASNGTLGDNAFHMNELLNGIELGTVQHLGSHANYNTVVFNKLENLFNNNGGLTISAELAENLVRNLANQIRTWIVTHPNTSVNQIVL